MRETHEEGMTAHTETAMTEAANRIQELEAALYHATRQLADETAIVDRIWDIYGRPSYQELAGKTIYDLINADRAQVEQLERQVAEMKAMLPAATES